ARAGPGMEQRAAQLPAAAQPADGHGRAAGGVAGGGMVAATSKPADDRRPAAPHQPGGGDGPVADRRHRADSRDRPCHRGRARELDIALEPRAYQAALLDDALVGVAAGAGGDAVADDGPAGAA